MILRWIVLSVAFHVASPSPSSHLGTSRYKSRLNERVYQQSGILFKERQISIFLYKNESKRLSLRSERAGTPLSIAITPCSSTIQWSVHFLPLNSSSSADLNTANKLREFFTDELKTFSTSSAELGQYVVLIRAIDSDSFLQIFGSSEPHPPHQVRMAQRPHIRLQKRLRRKRLTVKWDQSLIDPHVTEFCLVVSTKRNYTSLCGAMENDWNAVSGEEMIVPKVVGGRGRRMRPVSKPTGNNIKKMSSAISNPAGGDALISCVGTKTHHTLDNLEHGKMYYFNLFAINKETNLTFPYASTLLQFDQRIKQFRLKDGKPESINLRKLDGKAVFKFKAGKQTADSLVVSVMPCGGAVDVDITTAGGKSVHKRQRVESYGKLTVPDVDKGQRFLITIHTSNREELRKTDSVVVLATTRHNNPLPELPKETEVRMLKQDCDSVTVGWFPSPDPASVRYCVVARETRKREAETRLPDQCAIAKRLGKNTEFHLMQCRDWIIPRDSFRNQVMTQTIPNLRPGRRYMVQVTVKKNGGMTLSYNLLTVYTTQTCIE